MGFELFFERIVLLMKGLYYMVAQHDFLFEFDLFRVFLSNVDTFEIEVDCTGVGVFKNAFSKSGLRPIVF